MYEFRCPKCGEIRVLPSTLRCPICNKDLFDCTDEYSKKHIARCVLAKSPYIYSDCKPGRPSNKERSEVLNKRYI